MTDESIAAIAHGCKRLETLNLMYASFFAPQPPSNSHARVSTPFLSLPSSHCRNLTTVPKELCDIPTLKKIDTDGCNIAAPPQAICDEGPDAMRRYWAETAAAAISSR